MQRSSLPVAFALALATGCVGMSPPPASAIDASRAHIELADLQSGRSLLLSKCGGCHRPPMPAERRPHDWPVTLNDRSSRAHVDGTERHLIEEYLVTMAAR